MPNKRYAVSVARAIDRQELQRFTVAERIETALANGWSLRGLAAELGCSAETLRVRALRARRASR